MQDGGPPRKMHLLTPQECDALSVHAGARQGVTAPKPELGHCVKISHDPTTVCTVTVKPWRSLLHNSCVSCHLNALCWDSDCTRTHKPALPNLARANMRLYD
jgi:hypothetical protein